MSTLNINVAQKINAGRVEVTLALDGNLDNSTAATLEAKLTPTLASNPAQVIFDLARLKFVTSAGIRLFFVAVNQWGMGLTSWEKGKLKYKPGDVYMGVDYQMYRMGETIGHLKAIDISGKKVAWDVPSPLPFFSGMLATKGGVLFSERR